MDISNLVTLAGAAAGVIGLPIAVHYGHRATRPGKTRVQVRVTNMVPVYNLPGGGQAPGERFVAVEAVNTGDRPVTITGWGVKVPGGDRVVVTHSENWATPLPHRLEPGSDATRFLMPADELYRLHHQKGIPLNKMRPYVTLAGGTEVPADRSVPLT